MHFCQFADLLRDGLENVPIVFGFPGGRNSGLHRVDEGVQVGGVQVGLFVPGRGRQDDVRVQRRSVHAEVQIHHQVEFARRRFVAIFHFTDIAFRHLARHFIGVRAEIMFEHVLVSLHARADGVAAPDEPETRPVFGRVGVIHGKAQVAALQLRNDILNDLRFGFRARRFRVFDDLQRTLVELRKEGQRSLADGARLVINGVLFFLFSRQAVVGGKTALVTPLVGVNIVERRRVLLAAG